MGNSNRNHAMTVRTSLEQAAKSVMGALTPGQSEPDILDTLHNEHEEVQDLLEKLVDSDTAREQKQLLEKVKRALVPHSKAEESVVYDAVLALRGKDAQVDGNEGYVEHTLASATLKQLDTLPGGTPEFKATAKVLKELVSHHVDEEERNIWAQVKENFTDEQREQMNRDFLAAKKNVKV